ncbi:MAG: hypothetical protein OCD76_25235 [Reichenbachiella sp.]
MKYFYFFSLLLLMSCQSVPNDSSVKDEQTLIIKEEISVIDSVLISEEVPKNNPNTTETVLAQTTSNGKGILIDRIHYFPSTNEAYMWVGFKEGYDWKALDTLKTFADSVVFDDGEVKRTRYPMNIAREYLNLELLDNVHVFNNSHQSQGLSSIQRIEYFEDVLGDQFIVILNTPKKLTGDSFYGISGTTNFITNLSSKIINDEELAASIKSHINLTSVYDWRMGNISIDPYNSTYSFYSFASENGEKSFLLEIDETTKKITTMSEITNDYSIWEITPVPIQINRKPVLLLWLGVPETDIEWYSPAVYDGKKYKITNNRKLNLAELQSN